MNDRRDDQTPALSWLGISISFLLVGRVTVNILFFLTLVTYSIVLIRSVGMYGDWHWFDLLMWLGSAIGYGFTEDWW